MKKTIFLLVILTISFFLFGCTNEEGCPPDFWEGPRPPGCELDGNTEDNKALNPFEAIGTVVTPVDETGYDLSEFIKKELNYLSPPFKSEKEIIMGIELHDVHGKYCL